MVKYYFVKKIGGYLTLDGYQKYGNGEKIAGNNCHRSGKRVRNLDSSKNFTIQSKPASMEVSYGKEKWEQVRISDSGLPG